ncbi:MAG: DUF1800 domain-containing protein, partial [Rhodospirillaceae bacterium]|nr:DUF1800 domain-containing protein [Rhodospirillaceae bacterium]
MSRRDALIAAHRFGLGPKPGEIEKIGGDPRGWLLEQLEGPIPLPAAMQGLPPVSENVLDWWAAVTISVAELVKRIRKDYRDLWYREATARLSAAVTTDRPFHERLVWFWGNHFTVSGRKAVAIGMAGGHEREAVRPHVTGRFRPMLQEAASHPGMLFYLDNYGSVGPRSYRGTVTYYGRGLNENLGREILELHTLGVNGGYDQRDVRELAKMLTGWTFGRRYDSAPGQFNFNEKSHEPGPKRLMGQTYEEAGEDEGRAALDWLAGREATARHVVTKFARHFIADEPPAAAVHKMTRTFMDTDGDLKELARALIHLPEAWNPAPVKFKTPQEYVIGAMRAVGGDAHYRHLIPVLTSFGHLPFLQPSPAGWPDVETAWLNPDSALRRARFAAALAAEHGGKPTTAEIVRDTMEGWAPAETLAAIKDAANDE